MDGKIFRQSQPNEKNSTPQSINQKKPPHFYFIIRLLIHRCLGGKGLLELHLHGARISLEPALDVRPVLFENSGPRDSTLNAIKFTASSFIRPAA